MKSILNFFDNNPWLNLLFLILSILSIILAYYFYYQSKKEKKPVFNSKTISLFLVNSIIAKKIDIRYNGDLINNLSLTKIAFWNAGKESIRGDDIAPNAPFLIIAPEDVTIYGVEIVDQNMVNNFILDKVDEHKIKVHFDFIDFNDGVIINIFHSKFKKNGFTIQGTFIGAPKLSHGIQQDKLAVKLDFITKPMTYLFNTKKFVLQFLGILLIVPTIAVYFPLIMIILPIDRFLNKLNNKFQKKFFLEEVPVVSSEFGKANLG
jgi:hypothetical protein